MQFDVVSGSNSRSRTVGNSRQPLAYVYPKHTPLNQDGFLLVLLSNGIGGFPRINSASPFGLLVGSVCSPARLDEVRSSRGNQALGAFGTKTTQKFELLSLSFIVRDEELLNLMNEVIV